jgi:hypothetical protein
MSTHFDINCNVGGSPQKSKIKNPLNSKKAKWLNQVARGRVLRPCQVYPHQTARKKWTSWKVAALECSPQTI